MAQGGLIVKEDRPSKGVRSHRSKIAERCERPLIASDYLFQKKEIFNTPKFFATSTSTSISISSRSEQVPCPLLCCLCTHVKCPRRIFGYKILQRQ
mmetsp:Transcript_33427/g.66081  ORF Transcript_33427/g.66081 Transcript_33427/m.66081 type:complete len:96 (+) Transcript_33427:410-697(+)